MRVLAPNLVESFAFDLDLDLDMATFVQGSAEFASDVGLVELFLNVSEFLGEVASYGPELEAGGGDPSPIYGLLSGENITQFEPSSCHIRY